MKLVNYDDFCRMPAGTIFAPYTPCSLKEDLAIKTDGGYPMPEDYPYHKHSFIGVIPLTLRFGNECELFNIGDQQDAWFEIYDVDSNDYRDYKMFLVFEEADIDRMINVLLWAKNGCKGEKE